jgi:hypothetical protein
MNKCCIVLAAIGENMSSNKIVEILLKSYMALYSEKEAPEDMFKMTPAIPFIGKNYQDTDPKILSYASAENLSDDYDDNLQPNNSEIHQLEYQDQFNRSRYFYNKYNNKDRFFPFVHMEPFNNGSQLMVTRHIISKLGYNSKFENTPYGFIEQISVANPGKFSVACNKNNDYARDESKMRFSTDYIKADLAHLKPDIIVIPRTVYGTINQIKKWGTLLSEAEIQTVDFIQIYQLSFFNNDRIKKEIEGLPSPKMSKYLYGGWLEEIDSGVKVDINAHLSWIDNSLYGFKKVKSN